MKILLFFIFVLTSCGKPIFKSNAIKKPELEFSQASNNFWPEINKDFEINFINKPQIGLNSKFDISFFPPGSSVEEKLSEKFCVLLWMVMPNGSQHGSSPMDISYNSVSKKYEIDEVYFLMPGIWQIRMRTIDSTQVCSPLINSSYLSEHIIEISI